MEIEIFCAKYDRDGDFEFDVEELQVILTDPLTPDGATYVLYKYTLLQAIGREDADQFENMDHLTLESEKKEGEEEENQRKMTKGEFWQ